MPSGDASRAWFPEMLNELERQWNNSLSWEACGELCERLTDARTQLRQDKGLKGPIMHCHHCNALHEMRLGPITIRSMLFALRKLGLLTEQELTKCAFVFTYKNKLKPRYYLGIQLHITQH
jgi:hypothetical protein